MQLRLTSTVADTGIHKKILESETATLIISNKEIESIMKIVKLLEEYGLLIKDLRKINEAKKKKNKNKKTGRFFGMVLCKLG